ncbi:MAG: hypothetical protein HY335_03275, partial [Deinococcus sp.]|nr:hypothetical protein [Deinococcus sp.]
MRWRVRRITKVLGLVVLAAVVAGCPVTPPTVEQIVANALPTVDQFQLFDLPDLRQAAARARRGEPVQVNLPFIDQLNQPEFRQLRLVPIDLRDPEQFVVREKRELQITRLFPEIRTFLLFPFFNDMRGSKFPVGSVTITKDGQVDGALGGPAMTRLRGTPSPGFGFLAPVEPLLRAAKTPQDQIAMVLAEANTVGFNTELTDFGFHSHPTLDDGAALGVAEALTPAYEHSGTTLGGGVTSVAQAVSQLLSS